MTWILIIILTSPNITTIQQSGFDKQSCLVALKNLTSKMQFSSTGYCLSTEGEVLTLSDAYLHSN